MNDFMLLAWDLVLWFAFLDEFLHTLYDVFVELNGPTLIKKISNVETRK
jgi:hypothetical protein